MRGSPAYRTGTRTLSPARSPRPGSMIRFAQAIGRIYSAWPSMNAPDKAPLGLCRLKGTLTAAERVCPASLAAYDWWCGALENHLTLEKFADGIDAKSANMMTVLG